jgi:hypothetical protein
MPPAPGPAGGYPTFGMPVQPPVPPRNPRRPLIITGIAVAVALTVVVGLLVLVFDDKSGGRFDDSAGREARAARQTLTAAAFNLAQTPGVRYTGSYRDDNGDMVEVDARVTNRGWTQGALTREGQEISVLSNGPRSYLRAGKKYWSGHGAPRDSLGEYAKRWVRVPTEELGIDLARSLSPGVLGADLLLAVERDEIAVGAVSTMDGAQVREVTTRYATVYVTTAEPQQVVRIASRKPARDGQGGGGGEVVPTVDGPDRVRTPIDPEEFELDLESLSAAEAKRLFTDLDKRVRELTKSVDSQVRFALASRIRLSPCTVSGCTATVSMSNNVPSTSPYLVVSRTVVASITIRITLDKRTVKTCSPTRGMKPNSSTTVKCRARYTVPADGQTHHVEATAKAVARAAADADIDRMLDDLKAERTAGAPPRPDQAADLGERWQPCDPSRIEDEEGSCPEDSMRIHTVLGGETRNIRPPIGLSALGGYRGYDARWGQHLVVVKDGRVYDPWTGRYGEPVTVYKARWEWGDALVFGF